KAYLVPENGQIEKPTDIPAEYKKAYEDAYETLAGAASESDETLMDKYLEEGTLSRDEIITGLKQVFADNAVVPVFAGSPIKNSGMICVLDFISEIAPSPLESAETTGNLGEELTPVLFEPDAPLKAVVVKTSSDQFSGRLSYIKVVSGTLKSDSEVFNVSEERKEKISKLYRCVGKKFEEIKSLVAGDIGIAVKLAGTRTSDTLSANQNTVPFTPLRHPEPVYARAVSAKEKKDEDKMSEMLTKASDEDKTLHYQYNPETKQNVFSGMGELHINIVLERIKTQAKVNIDTAIPRVAYRETIQKTNSAEYTHKKQSGGHGQYGKVVLTLEPLARGENYKFTNSIFGGAISKGYIPGVEKGIKEAMENGILAGYPVVDVGVTITDGKEHPVDSSEMAFKIAARNAFREASKVCSPILLEPIMNITIWVESKYLGDIMSDISGKRGRILGQSPLGGGIEEIRAQAPEAELLKYAIDLRSMTSGTGSFETSFAHYDPISGKIADDVIAQAKEFMPTRIEDD
ncbi:MAG: elongation factor G, partial [Treponema sp.]|nr:elongation factor G [Treponema sp.]